MHCKFADVASWSVKRHRFVGISRLLSSSVAFALQGSTKGSNSRAFSKSAAPARKPSFRGETPSTACSCFSKAPKCLFRFFCTLCFTFLHSIGRFLLLPKTLSSVCFWFVAVSRFTSAWPLLASVLYVERSRWLSANFDGVKTLSLRSGCSLVCVRHTFPFQQRFFSCWCRFVGCKLLVLLSSTTGR